MNDNYVVKMVETRKYVRRDRVTGELEEVTVSNRNGLGVEEHLRLLNLNDPGHEYFDLPWPPSGDGR